MMYHLNSVPRRERISTSLELKESIPDSMVSKSERAPELPDNKLHYAYAAIALPAWIQISLYKSIKLPPCCC